MGLFSSLKIGLFVVAALAVAGLWIFFRLQQGKIEDLNEALARTNQLRAAAEARLALSEIARDEADRTESVNQITRTVLVETEREIADAQQRQDAHAMYVAWRAGVSRLRDVAGSAPA